jgi:hypothetical protein
MAFSVTSANSGTTRRYASFSQMLHEGINARVWSGTHFRTADEDGARIGVTVARYSMRRYFAPERHHRWQAPGRRGPHGGPAAPRGRPSGGRSLWTPSRVPVADRHPARHAVRDEASAPLWVCCAGVPSGQRGSAGRVQIETLATRPKSSSCACGLSPSHPPRSRARPATATCLPSSRPRALTGTARARHGNRSWATVGQSSVAGASRTRPGPVRST